MTMTDMTVRPRNGGVTVPHDPITLGNILAASGFFTDSREGAQAAVKVMAGQEMGFGPIASMTGIYIVKGRVTVSSNLMAAAIKRQRPRYDYRVKQHTPTACEIDFLQDGEVIGTSSYTMEEAQTAGLAGSETYKKHPRNMLFARALSNGAKWYCPDIFGGPIYTPDELGQEIDGETGEVVNYTPPEPQQITQATPVEEPAGEVKMVGKTASKQLDDQLGRYLDAGLVFDRVEMQAVALGGELDTAEDAEGGLWHLLTREQGLSLYEWMQAETEGAAA